jgi:hypothetical protein
METFSKISLRLPLAASVLSGIADYAYGLHSSRHLTGACTTCGATPATA